MVHIGKIIKRVIKERGLSITEFGKRINTHRRNVYDIFERESADTALLQKIGHVLEHDFFGYFRQNESGRPADNKKVFNEPAVEYGKTEKNKLTNEQLTENLETCYREMDYLKQLIAGKDKIISGKEKVIILLEKRNSKR